MLWQAAVVAVIVTTCATYAVWSLLPRSARKSVALRLLERPLPGVLAHVLQKQVAAASGCGCDGCDKAAPAAPKAVAVQPIVFHRKTPGPR